MFDFRQFPGRAWPLVVFGFISVFWGNFGQSFFVGVYGESFKQTLNLSASQYGSLYSLATFIAGFAFLFLGTWIDRFSLQRFAVFAGLGLGLACIILGLTANVGTLFVGLLFVRLFGQSMLPHTGMITMARAFEKNRGKALGAAASAIPVGEIILPLVAVSLIFHLGWQQSWLLYAALVVTVYIPLAVLLLRREVLHEEEVKNDSLVTEVDGRFSLLKTLQFWLILPSVLLGPFVVTGIFIHQDYVLQARAWTGTQWASSFVAYGIVHWLSSFLVGVLIDKYSAKKLIAWLNLPIVLAIATLLLENFPFSAVIFLSLLGISIGFAGPLTAALWTELYGKKHLGGIRSMVTAFVVVSTALSPVLFGVAIDSNVSLSIIVVVTMAAGGVTILASLRAFTRIPG